MVELGAAGGRVGRALPGSIALDWASEGLRDARARVQGDVRALPVRDASVDAIVAIHVLGHLWARERAPALREWARALKPDGALILEVFAQDDARADAGDEVEPGTRLRAGIPTHAFARAELDALLHEWRIEITQDERRHRWGTRRVLRARCAPRRA